MADDVQLSSFPASAIDAVAWHYLLQEDLLDLDPAQVYKLFVVIRAGIPGRVQELKSIELPERFDWLIELAKDQGDKIISHLFEQSN